MSSDTKAKPSEAAQGCLVLVLLLAFAFLLGKCSGFSKDKPDKYGLGFGINEIAKDLNLNISEIETVPSRYDPEGKELKHVFYGKDRLVIETIGDPDNARYASIGVQWGKGDETSVNEAINNLWIFSKTCAPDTVLIPWLSKATSDVVKNPEKKGTLLYKDRTFTLKYVQILGSLFLTCEKNGSPKTSISQKK